MIPEPLQGLISKGASATGRKSRLLEVMAKRGWSYRQMPDWVPEAFQKRSMTVPFLRVIVLSKLLPLDKNPGIVLPVMYHEAVHALRMDRDGHLPWFAGYMGEITGVLCALALLTVFLYSSLYWWILALPLVLALGRFVGTYERIEEEVAGEVGETCMRVAMHSALLPELTFEQILSSVSAGTLGEDAAPYYVPGSIDIRSHKIAREAAKQLRNQGWSIKE